MPTDDLITYDAVNKKLETVPRAFAERTSLAVSWVWRPDIGVGAEIQPQTVLADLQWDDNRREPVAAPPGCSGVIIWRNSDFDYLSLRYIEQTVLRIRHYLNQR